MLTVADVLEMQELKRGIPEVLAGSEALDREVRWAHVLDVAEVSDLLKGGEFVLNNGFGIGLDARTQRGFIRQLSEQGAAAVAVEMALLYKAGLPEAFADEAQRVNLPLIALHRRTRFIEVTEAVHARLLDEQFESLRASETFNRRVTAIAVAGGSIQEILDELSKTMATSVVLEDSSRRVIDWSSAGQEENQILRMHRDLAREEAEVEAAGIVAAPIRFGDLLAGRLVVFELDQPLPAIAQGIVDHTAEILSLQLASRRRMEEVAAHSRGAFLDELIAGRASEPQAEERARSLGFRRRSEWLVPVAVAWRSGSAASRRPDWDVVAVGLRSATDRHSMEALVGPRAHQLLTVIDPGRQVDEADFGPRIAAIIYESLSELGLGQQDLALAIGSACGQWLQIGPALERTAIRAATASIEPSAPWYDARRLGVADLLFALRESPILTTFVADRIGALSESQDPRRDDLMTTLRTYLEHAGRKTQAARALNLERQSIYHRLDRLQKILDVDWNQGEDLAALHLALIADQLLHAGADER